MPSKAFIERPASQSRKNNEVFLQNLLRDQMSLPNWLLLAATVQTAAFLLFPVHTSYIAAPTLLLATFRLLQLITAVSTYKADGNDGRIIGKRTTATIDRDLDATGGVCVLLLGTRTHHPLGILAPGVQELGQYFLDMVAVLEQNAAKFGFRGSKSYLSAGDATRNSESITLFYFQDHESVHKFAHSEVHMNGWNWWNRTQKLHPHIGIMHEMYDAPAGNWESVYVNYEKSGLAATSYPITDEEGQQKWMPTFAEAGRRGQTSLSRMGHGDGSENDKYGPDPYAT